MRFRDLLLSSILATGSTLPLSIFAQNDQPKQAPDQTQTRPTPADDRPQPEATQPQPTSEQDKAEAPGVKHDGSKKDVGAIGERKVGGFDIYSIETDIKIGKAYAAQIDQTVKLGDTEEWTVVNTDQQYHSFHIHQTGFLVTEINGVRQNEDGLRDTFSMLPATDDGPSVLKVIIPFTDPVIVGRFVYHCHAVDHEDKGMMGVVEVVP
jgi:FtsP/CotA-like multicopper oxidase with cupredoxin domain